MSPGARRATELLLVGCLLLAACRAAPERKPAVAPPTPTAEPSPMPTSEPTPELPVMPTPLPLPPELGRPMPRPSGQSVPARLVIPRIELDAPVVEVGVKLEGDRAVWDTASHAVGYHRGTGVPGQPGNVVLAGHISSLFRGNVFKRLPELSVGDSLVLLTRDQTSLLYRVEDRTILPPSAVEVMAPTPEETVTLITCVPDGVYTQRLVVRGRRVQA